MFRKLLINYYNSAVKLNEENILFVLEEDKDARLLDLGCDTGEWTLKIAKKVGSNDVYGVEIVDKRIRQAKTKGIKVVKADLNGKLPFKNAFFDIVHANQIIEHLHETDNFISEIYRVLKPKGYAIISTENLSSWHNIFSLVLGWQPFSMTNFSSKGSIGNPFSLWRKPSAAGRHLKAWEHMRLFSYRGLKEVFQKYNFVIERLVGAGYYPLPAFFGNLDVRHSHFLCVKIRKTRKDYP
jgi:SAM-dependent methyltransferase